MSLRHPTDDLEDDAGRLRYTTRQLSSILLPDEPVPHITFGDLPEGTAAEYADGVIYMSPEWVAARCGQSSAPPWTGGKPPQPW